MKWLFRKKKIANAVKEDTALEGVTNSIVSVCLHFQRKWADLMQRYSERLPQGSKLIILFMFCLIASISSLYLIFSSVMHQSTSSIAITHFKAALFTGKSGDENTKATGIVAKAEYERIQHFQFYMDSLAGSSYGRKIYDSILNQRPGLIDSVLLIENVYQSQSKN